MTSHELHAWKAPRCFFPLKFTFSANKQVLKAGCTEFYNDVCLVVDLYLCPVLWKSGESKGQIESGKGMVKVGSQYVHIYIYIYRLHET